MTDALELIFPDVSLGVLKEYLKLLGPKYHHGCYVYVEQEFPEDVYKHAYYFDDADGNEETQKYCMKTDCDLTRIQYKIWKYNHWALHVIYHNSIKVHLKNYNISLKWIKILNSKNILCIYIVYVFL